MSKLAYYIGVDHREPEATVVCEYSARDFSSQELPIHHLDHLDLRKRQLFDRPWRITEDGIMYDERDGRPFSTQFAHSRFLTPIVAKKDGYSEWALFTDADWMWMHDPWKILEEADPTKTVMVVPHNYAPTTAVKMDGQPQTKYSRKLWSALMLWNLKSKHLPTVEAVNMAEGGYLHRFGWLPDSQIGFLSEAWHWLPNVSPTTDVALRAQAENKTTPIHAIHFTTGVPLPSMTERERTPFDAFWYNNLVDGYRNKY